MTLRPGVLALVLLNASSALAQRVVILEIDGDKGGKLRTQVEAALRKADSVELVSIDKYKSAAAKKKVKGPAAMTPAGVAKIARALKIDAAVGGEVDKKFAVTIWDSAGQQLWNKDLKIKGGLLSSDFSSKLARAITAAAKTAPKAEEEDASEDGDGGDSDDASAPPRKVAKRQSEGSSSEDGVSPPPPPPRRGEGEEGAEEANAQREPERDQDLESEGKKTKNKIGPKTVSIWLAGTTTWRYYCARPGVDTCAEYDGLPMGQMPQGDIVDFRPQVPYAGFNIQAELFPLAAFMDNALQGIGLVGSFGLGFSLTNVTVDSSAGQAKCPDGSDPPCPVVSTDRSWTAMLAYRYYFSFDPGAKNVAVGYAGIRAGAAGRVFEIDAKAQVPLPGANRIYPVIAADIAIPIIKYFSVELSGSFFINPKPGPDEIAGYGDMTSSNGGASGFGFQLEGGFAGTIWGPVGYRLRLRYTPFTDHFTGTGQKWVYTMKGAAFESYTSFIWGITASF